MAVTTVTSQLAFSVYSYSSAATGVGEAGRVDYDSGAGTLSHFVRSSQISTTVDGNIAGLTPDPKVFWFENDADTADPGRLLVAQTYYDAAYGPANQSLFSVYRASDLTQIWPTNDAAGVTWDTTIVNVYDIVTLKVGDIEYIYGIDYDNHKVFRVKIGTDMNDNELYTFDSTASYTYTGSSAYTFGQDIETDGENIFALFLNTSGSYGGTYANSTIVRLSPNLSATTAVVNTSLAGNAVSLVYWTGGSGENPTPYFYIPAIGGPQNYGGPHNPDSVIQRIDTGLTTVQTLLINEPIPDPENPPTPGLNDTTDYYSIAFKTDGAATTKAFILKGVYYPNSTTFTWRLYGTTLATINTGAPNGVLISTLIRGTAAGTYPDGYLWALFYNAADDNVWFVRGNEIVIYDYNTGAPTTAPSLEAGPIVMGNTPASNLAPSGYNLNMGGAAIYGIVGTIGGAQHPQGSAAQRAAAGKAEEEK